MCHTTEVIDDDICENSPNEHFFSDLSYVIRDQPVSITPERTRVVINDGSALECGKP